MCPLISHDERLVLSEELHQLVFNSSVFDDIEIFYPHDFVAVYLEKFYSGSAKQHSMCIYCNELTKHNKDNGIYLENGIGPVCLNCYHKTSEFAKNVEETYSGYCGMPNSW